LTEDLFTSLSKKKKAGLPKPEKVSTHFTASKPSNSTLQKPQRVQSPKVKAPKVKPVRPKAKQQQQTQAQARVQQTQQPQQSGQSPKYQNTDFKFLTSVDQAGVSILTDFRGKSIHKFLLPGTDYALFVGLNPQQKYNYVQVRVRPNAFWNNMQLVHQVILTICNILDTLFAETQRILRQQEQQQRR